MPGRLARAKRGFKKRASESKMVTQLARGGAKVKSGSRELKKRASETKTKIGGAMTSGSRDLKKRASETKTKIGGAMTRGAAKARKLGGHAKTGFGRLARGVKEQGGKYLSILGASARPDLAVGQVKSLKKANQRVTDEVAELESDIEAEADDKVIQKQIKAIKRAIGPVKVQAGTEMDLMF